MVAALHSALGTEAGGRTLALGRNLPAYVISADLVSLKTADPSFDTSAFRPWLRSLLSKTLDGKTLVSTDEDRPNNWGTHAGAARAAIAAYLGDSAEMARTAQVFRGWLGDRSAYAGFTYGDLSWQCDPAHPVGINATGCTKNGVDIGGSLPEEMRRGGTFHGRPRSPGMHGRRCREPSCRPICSGLPATTRGTGPTRRSSAPSGSCTAAPAGPLTATTPGSPGSSIADTGRHIEPPHRLGPGRTSAIPTG